MNTPFIITPEGLADTRPLEHRLEDRTRAAYQRLTEENAPEGSFRWLLLRADYLDARATEFDYLATISDPQPAAEFAWAAREAAYEQAAIIARLTENTWVEVPF